MAYFRGLYEQWIGFPRSIKFFYLSDAFFGFAMAIFSTLFNLHLLQIGYTASHIGTLNLVGSLVMAVFALPIGLAGDRWGRRWLYVAGSMLFGIPFMIMPFLKGFTALLIVNAVYNVGNTLMMVNESPLLAGEVGPERRASVFSFMFINFFIWNTLGVQLAGFLVDWLPAGDLSKYQWPLVVAGVSGIVAGLVRMLLPFRPQARASAGLRIRPSRVALLLGLVSVLAGGAGMLTQGFTNVTLSARFDLHAEAISTIMFMGGVMGWFGSLFVPYLSGRVGDRKGYAMVLGLQGFILIYLGFAGTTLLFVPGLWARSFIGTMQMALWSAFAMDATPSEERATANSYSIIGRNVGSAVAAKTYGVMIAGGSFVLPYSVAGLLALATALFAFTAFRRTNVD